MSDITGREDAPEAVEFGAAPIEPVAVEIAVGNGPISGLAVSGDGSRLMVANYGSHSVSVIDTDRCQVIETVEGLDEPFAIAAGGAGSHRAYVSTVSPAYDAIAVIDTSTHSVVATHPLALSVSDLAIGPQGRCVYASRNGARVADLAVLDTETGALDTIDLEVQEPGSTADYVSVSPDGERACVGVNGSAGGRLVMIGAATQPDEPVRRRWRRQPSTGSRERNASRVVGSVSIGLPIRGLALSPDGALAYVASCDPDVGVVVDVVDTRTHKITSTCKLGETSGLLTGLTLSADGDRAYLVGDDWVTVLCTLTQDVVGTLRFPAQPSCVAESPDAKRLYVADYSGTVSVASVAWGGPLATEDAMACGDVPTAWLTQYQPALA